MFMSFFKDVVTCTQTGSNNFPTPTNNSSFDPFSGGDPFATPSNTTTTGTGFDDAFATNWGGKVRILCY